MDTPPALKKFSFSLKGHKACFRETPSSEVAQHDCSHLDAHFHQHLGLENMHVAINARTSKRQLSPGARCAEASASTPVAVFATSPPNKKQRPRNSKSLSIMLNSNDSLADSDHVAPLHEPLADYLPSSVITSPSSTTPPSAGVSREAIGISTPNTSTIAVAGNERPLLRHSTLATVDILEQEQSSMEMVDPAISYNLPSPCMSPNRSLSPIDELRTHSEGVSMDGDAANVAITDDREAQMPALLQIPDIIATFDTYPSSMKSYLMFHLMKRCSKNTLQFITLSAMPHLRRDFLGELPRETSRHIVQYLDSVSLCRASMVSRKWNDIIYGDEHLWNRRLALDRLDYAQQERKQKLDPFRTEASTDPAATTAAALPSISQHQDSEQPLRPSLVATSSGHSRTSSGVSPSTEAAKRGEEARREYERSHRIHQNWLNGNAEHLSFPGHGHSVVTCLQFDSDKIVSGSDDKTINVFDIRTGKLLQKLEGHEGGVWALQYVGNALVSGSTDRTVRVWDIERSRCTHIFPGHTSTVRCLQIVCLRTSIRTRVARLSCSRNILSSSPARETPPSVCGDCPIRQLIRRLTWRHLCRATTSSSSSTSVPCRPTRTTS